MSIITRIGTANPPHQHQQSEILDYMLQVYDADRDTERRVKALYRIGGIKTRHSALPDFNLATPENELFGLNGHVPVIEDRLSIYNDAALPLAISAIKNAIADEEELQEVTHLITVSCTGMVAPGLDLQLMRALNLKTTVYRTSVNFMGCYAALHALKQADFICRAEQNAKVLVVCVELCTLHFQKKLDTDNLMATMLFADGAAAVLVCSDEANGTLAHQEKGFGLRIKNHYSDVAIKGWDDMAWEISKDGFLMRLSTYVPDIIEEGVGSLLNSALKQAELAVDVVDHWAFHPGGRRILDVIYKSLELERKQLWASYEVLSENGNMSSPTILFVIEKLWELMQTEEKNKHAFAAAFGPGLTLETMVLESV